MRVAAAIRVVISHSSSRSRTRSSTRRGRLALRRREAGSLVDLFDEILAEAALHFGMNRHQLRDPSLALLRGEVVNLDLAGRSDLLERVRIVLGGRVVEELGRLFHG